MSKELFQFVGDPKQCWLCHRQEGAEVPSVEMEGDTVISESTRKIKIMRISEETAEEVYYVCDSCRTILRGIHTLIHATAPLV
ncbi:MAG: hypothetical protein ACE5R6_07285 [Candidatus Heimdallarchaeota archaeon]